MAKAESRKKGKRGELEWSKVLRQNGINARRGQQYSGGGDSPDVVSDLDDVHFEVKRVEQLNLYRAVNQATTDAGIGKMPVVAHRRNNRPWLVTLHASDAIKLLKSHFGLPDAESEVYQ